MFNLEPVGKFHIQLCGTTPCVLRGAEDLKRVCRDRIGEPGQVSADGKFSWLEVECLGACVNAPMALINFDYYEDMTAESFEKVLDGLAAGKAVEPGPQIDRQFSAPVGGPTTLIDPSLYSAGATKSVKEPVLADSEAKKPTGAASNRESPAPKPPHDDKTKPKAR